jgi:hypothetical protein
VIYKLLPLEICHYPVHSEGTHTAASDGLFVVPKFPRVVLLWTCASVFSEARPVFASCQLKWAALQGVGLIIKNLHNFGVLLSQITTCVSHNESDCPVISKSQGSSEVRERCYQALGGHHEAHRLLKTKQHYRGHLRELTSVLERSGARKESSIATRSGQSVDEAYAKEMQSTGLVEVRFKRSPVRLSVRLDMEVVEGNLRRVFRQIHREWEWYWLYLPLPFNCDLRCTIHLEVGAFCPDEKLGLEFKKKNLFALPQPLPMWAYRDWLSVKDVGGEAREEVRFWDESDWV